jgi:hypothetical protein
MAWAAKTLPFIPSINLAKWTYFFGIQAYGNSFRLALTALATFRGVPIVHKDTYVRI